MKTVERRSEKFNILNQRLKELGVPVAYHHFDEPQELPFIVYYSSSMENFSADNEMFYQFDYFDVEVYTDFKDLVLEDELHDLFVELGLQYEHYEVYIKEEKMYMQNFTLTW